MRKIKNTHQIILPLTTTYTHLYFKKWAIFTTQHTPLYVTVFSCFLDCM